MEELKLIVIIPRKEDVVEKVLAQLTELLPNFEMTSTPERICVNSIGDGSVAIQLSLCKGVLDCYGYQSLDWYMRDGDYCCHEYIDYESALEKIEEYVGESKKLVSDGGDLVFEPSDDKSYGLIGSVVGAGSARSYANVYKEAFYMADSRIPVSRGLIDFINKIQETFK